MEIEPASNTSKDLTITRSQLYVMIPTGPPKDGRSTESENIFFKIRSKIMDKLGSFTARVIMQDAQLNVSNRLSPRRKSALGRLCRSAKLGYHISRRVGSLRVATIERRNAGYIESGK